MAAVSAPPPPSTTVTVPLSRGAGGMKKLLSSAPKGEHQLTLTPTEIIVEHGMLEAPLRFAPGSVAVASIDHGPGNLGKEHGRGRFPVLHRLAANRVVPREQGIEGWVWTNQESSAFTVLTDEAPNVAFVFSPPIAAERLEGVFTDDAARRGRQALAARPAGAVRPAAALGVAHGARPRFRALRLPDARSPTARSRPRSVATCPTTSPPTPRSAPSRRDRAKTSVPPPGVN